MAFLRIHPNAWRVTSRTVPGRRYLVMTLNGRAACNCWGAARFRFTCYHEREVMKRMEESAGAFSSNVTYRPGDPAVIKNAQTQALVPITVTPPREYLPNPQDMAAIIHLSKNAPAMAGFAIPKSIDHPGKAFAILLAGWQFGVPPMVAFRHMVAINGSIEPDAQLMMGIALARDPTVRFVWVQVDREATILEIFRRGEFVIRVGYTVQDADAAGQLVRPKKPFWNRGKARGSPPDRWEEYDGPWQTHLTLMLAYNAIKIGLKLGAPDLINAVQGLVTASPELTTGLDVAMDYDGLPDLGDMTDADFQPDGMNAAQAYLRSQLTAAIGAYCQGDADAIKVAWNLVAHLVGGRNYGLIQDWLDANQGATIADLVRYAHGGEDADPWADPEPDPNVVDSTASEAPSEPQEPSAGEANAQAT